MYSKETTVHAVEPAGISDIRDFRRREREWSGRRKKRIRTADDRFAALDEENQRSVICHMIGYMEALNDNILSGKRVRTDEVSRIFESMEKAINKKWEGGRNDEPIWKLCKSRPYYEEG